MAGRQTRGAGQPEVVRGRRDGDRGGTVFDPGGHFLSGTEVGLVDDAGRAVDAGAFDDVVVELVAFFLGDEGSHKVGNTTIQASWTRINRAEDIC